MLHGYHATGIGALAALDDDAPGTAFEARTVTDDLRYRQRTMARDVLWPHPDIRADESKIMSRLFASRPGGGGGGA